MIVWYSSSLSFTFVKLLKRSPVKNLNKIGKTGLLNYLYKGINIVLISFMVFLVHCKLTPSYRMLFP